MLEYGINKFNLNMVNRAQIMRVGNMDRFHVLILPISFV